MTYRVQLDNGVRIIGEEIHSMRSVSIGVWINTGSRYETVDNNGISHFLEHMFFKGTDRYSARELAQLFDGLGGQVNAFTSKEYTCYYARVLDEHFSVAVDTLADMLFHSKFVPDEIEKEKKVVIEEIRMYEDTPDELVMDILAESVYGGHPLGYTILGREENLHRFSKTDIFAYIEDRYHASQIVVSIAGNIDKKIACEQVSKLFSQAATKSKNTTKTLNAPDFHRTLCVREKDIEQVHLTLASPGFAAGNDKLYPFILLNNALGNTSSSRLFQEIREERGMAYSVFSFHSAYQDSGMFGVYAGTSPEHVEDVLTLIHEICSDVGANGLSEDELRKGKEQVKGSMMLSLESTSSRMSRLGKNELLLGRDVPLDETLDAINRVSVADVRAVAAELLSHPFAISAVGPVRDIDLSKWLQ